MTELSCVSFMTDPSKVCLLEDRSSVGTPLPHTSAKVVDSDLNTVPPGTRGELLVSGYLMFSGYYKNSVKTDQAFIKDAHGRRWLRTGDIVTLTDSGTCMVVGRAKDMIKKGERHVKQRLIPSKEANAFPFVLGGENIAPADIEKVLVQHPDVAAVAVVGIPDARWGETIGAYVQCAGKGQHGPDSKAVKTWLRNRIGPNKIPDHFFWVGEEEGVPQELPVNASGKVLKTELSSIASRLLKREVVCK